MKDTLKEIASKIQDALIDQTMQYASKREILRWARINGYVITSEEAKEIKDIIEFRA